MNKTITTHERTRGGALHLTQQVDYALFLLSTLAAAEKGCSVRSISQEHQLSFSFLQKVAGILQRAGFIKALRGKYGGYLLAMPAKKITLKHIIETLDGPIAVVDCGHGDGVCPREKMCRIKKELQQMNAEIKKTYHAKTIADLVARV